MTNIIIFSNSGLICLALNNTLNDMVHGREGHNAIKTDVCRSLAAFQQALEGTGEPVVIFDVDGIPAADQMTVFTLLKRRLHKKNFVIFCKESRDTAVFNAFRHFSALTISKCETIDSLKASLTPLIFDEGMTDTLLHRPVLTGRETELLPYILLNASDKVIALFLGMTVKTVNGHRRNIYFKYQVKSLSGLRERLDGRA